MDNPQSISLSKYIAQSGYASRRNAAQLIKDGKVTLNGQTCLNPGERVNPGQDQIICKQSRSQDLITIKLPKSHNYLILNKPLGFLCTTSDPFKRKTVYSLIPDNIPVYPVGRLDQDSRGLLILTNDGFLNNELTSPRYHIPKTYQVTILGQIKPEQLTLLRSIAKSGPMQLEDITIHQPVQVRVSQSSPKKTILEFVLTEGKKRQIRRMCAYAHLHILDLMRVKIGPLELGTLKEGHWRRLSNQEVADLKAAIKL